MAMKAEEFQFREENVSLITTKIQESEFASD